MELIENAAEVAAFITVVFVLEIIAYMIHKSYPNFFTLRRVPAIDAIDEAIRSCVEKGRSAFHGLGSIRPHPRNSAFMVGAQELLKYSAVRCSEFGIPLYSTSAYPETDLLTRDFMRQGFIEGGHPELFDDNRVYWAGSIQGMMFQTLSLMEDNDIGAVVIVGAYNSGTACPVFEVSSRLGAICVNGEVWPQETCHGALGADYLVLPEEICAGGAYISKDPEQAAFLVGSDFVKLFWIGLMLVLTIATLAGLR